MDKKDYEISEKKSILISVDIIDLNLLKEKGISRSEFFRQSVEAYKQDKFVYDFSKQK